MKDKLTGSALLLFATIIWGSAFVVQSVGLDYVEPFTFQAIRCALAVVGLMPVIFLLDMGKADGSTYWKRWANPRLWIASFSSAIPLFVAISLQQIGLLYTEPGKSAFLTAMYIVIVPIIGVFFRRKMPKLIFVSVILAVTGLYFLCCAGAGEINVGDLLEIGSAFGFAVQITCIDLFSEGVDGVRMNCLQALICSVLSFVAVFLFETPKMDAILSCWAPLCYAGFLSMGVAYSLQIIGQQKLEASTASLLMSTESVFAVLTSWLFLHETMSAAEAFGCVLVFSAVILSQLTFEKKKEQQI